MSFDTRPLIGLTIAVLATAIVGSIVQTQISLAALSAIGAPIKPGMLLKVAIQDLITFGSVMAAITGAAFLVAFPAVHLIGRFTHRTGRPIIAGLGGGISLGAAFWMMGFFTPMPSLVAATRDAAGHFAMAMTGVIGGIAYAYFTRPSLPPRHVSPVRSVSICGLMAAVVLAFFAVGRPKADSVPLADASRFRVETVATDFAYPWSIAILSDGRLLISERAGRLRMVSEEGTHSDIDVGGLPGIYRGGINGLMDVAVDPDFVRNNLLYLTMSYGTRDANGTRLVRARLDTGRLSDVRTLFESTPKDTDGNNGGRVTFLKDGSLILTLGDGLRRREEAQNPAHHLGKLVRLDRDGRPPADNPFVGKPHTAPEVYSLGHRNAQGAAVDPEDGSLLISEHGPRGGDEVNLVRSGANYGWPVVTGGLDYSFARVSPFRRLAGSEPPLVEWTPSIAPAGLAVYRGALFPEWKGSIFVAALKERSIRRIARADGRVVGQESLLSDRKERIRDVKVGQDGSLYVLTDGARAQLLRLTPAAP